MEKMKRASLKGILLLVLMLFMLMPLYAFAEDEPYSIKVADEGVTEIGTYGNSAAYYVTVPEGTTSVSFDDILDDDVEEYASIMSLLGDELEDTKVAPVSDDWHISESTAKQNITLDQGVEEPDYSNVYYYRVYPIDDEYCVFIVSMPSQQELPDITFEATANGDPLTVKSIEEDGYTYHDQYFGDQTVDLYTLEIPFGVSQVDLSFSGNVLAYSYGQDGATYIAGYYDDYAVGANSATVPVNANVNPVESYAGTIPADNEFDVIQVQRPYVGADSELLYGITFEYAKPDPIKVQASLADIFNGTQPALPEGYEWKEYPTFKAGEPVNGKAVTADPAVGVPCEVPVAITQPGFTVSANGVVFDTITYSKENIDPQDGYTTPFDLDVFTVEIPYSLEKIDFTFTDDVLAYNYTKKGDYIKGWVDDPTVGFKEATIDVDANTDNDPDYIYVQLPYRQVGDNWEGGDLHYAVTFKRVADTNQPMTAKAKKAYTVKAKTLKKKAVKLSYKKVMTIKNAQGKLTFKKLSGKKIKVSSKGTITVPKKLKKGKYTIKVKVTAAGKEQYKSGYKTVKFTIKVK